VKLVEEGIPLSLEHEAKLEHLVPAGERVAAWRPVQRIGF